MGRPKTENPKRVVTLRLRPELIAHYEALGGSWRAHMEAALERFGRPTPSPEAPKRPERPTPAVHVDIPVFERKRFNPQPKRSWPK